MPTLSENSQGDAEDARQQGKTSGRSAYLGLEIFPRDSQNASDILLELVRECEFDILDYELIGADEEAL